MTFAQPELSLCLRKIKHLRVYLNNLRVTFLLVHFTYALEKGILSQLEKAFSTADTVYRASGYNLISIWCQAVRYYLPKSPIKKDRNTLAFIWAILVLTSASGSRNWGCHPPTLHQSSPGQRTSPRTLEVSL